MATEQIMFRVPPEVKEFLRERAYRENRPQTAIVLDAIAQYRQGVEGTGDTQDAQADR